MDDSNSDLIFCGETVEKQLKIGGKARKNKLEKVFELYALVGILGISKLFL